MERRCFISNEGGASSAEFALIIVPFLSIVMAVLGFCMLLWTSAALRYAAEDAARCASVKTAVCPDATTTQNYALSRYEGPAISPTFTYTVASCTSAAVVAGHTVTGTATFAMNTGLINLSLPLTVRACFP
jgi:Flp pilus assembly protein TadG